MQQGCPNLRLTAGVVLANSELADEGARDVAGGRFLAQPGSYRIGGLSLEGFANPHDRVGGRRFGNATLWRWQQGASALPISVPPLESSRLPTACCSATPMC